MPSNTQRDVTHINTCNSQKSLQNFAAPMGLWFHLEMGESWGGMREMKAGFPKANVLNAGFDHRGGDATATITQSLTRAVMCHSKKV